MKTEESIERLFETFLLISKNFDQQIRSWDEQIRRAQVEYLESAFQQQKDTLADCVKGIDQQLLALSVYLEECQRLQSSLHDLNEKLTRLGAASLPMPESPSGNITALLTERLDHLKSQGKV